MELKADNLVKIYGKRTVVKGVSFNVKQGEIVGLLGPNGAGKTTSFYMIVGIIKPNEGKVYLDDRYNCISYVSKSKTRYWIFSTRAKYF